MRLGLRGRILMRVLVALAPPTAVAVLVAVEERGEAREHAETDVLDATRLAAVDDESAVDATANFLAAVADDLAARPGLEHCKRLLALVPRHRLVPLRRRGGARRQMNCGATASGLDRPIKPVDGNAGCRGRSCQAMAIPLNDLAARAVIGVDGAVWSANSAFCSLVGLEEPALRRLGWRELVHSADRRYVAAHLVEALAGGEHRRAFDARLLPADGRHVPAHIRVELVRDGDGRRGWFLLEAWATT